jgi:hypothetical protein
MSKKSDTEKVGAIKQDPPLKNEGLIAQVLSEFFKRLRADTAVGSSVAQSLEELASKGKLKDLGAVQTALSKLQKAKDNAPS